MPLADNQPLSDAEFDRCCRLIKIIAAMAQHPTATGGSGALYWDDAAHNPGQRKILEADRFYIDHSIVLHNRFRDFPTIAYELPDEMPAPGPYIGRYASIREALPEYLRVKIPARFGEIGWDVAGYPANRHTAFTQERIAGMHLLGVTDYLKGLLRPTLLEIGAGGGEFGHVLKSAFPESLYVNCDLPVSLANAAIHLATWFPDQSHFVYVGDWTCRPILTRLWSCVVERTFLRCPAC